MTTEIAWYKRQMADPNLPRETYMKYWNVVRDWEQRATATYNEGLRRLGPKEECPWCNKQTPIEGNCDHCSASANSRQMKRESIARNTSTTI